ERSPITFGLEFFVWNRAFHHQDERIDFSGIGVVEELHELITYFVSEDGITKIDFWDARNHAPDDIFDAWVGSGSHGNCVAITAESSSEPENIDFLDCFGCGHNFQQMRG